LNSSRFFKVALCEYKKNKYDVLLCIVKGFIKHESDSKLHIANYKEELESIKERLHNVPNVLPYYAIIETESCLFLTRQYISQTLYERMSTRPFLTLIEKKWIAFQMLQALKFCKDRGVRHGDIKSENVLITSWNWVLLTDFAIFKPTFLRKDNPAAFAFFFDTSGRRTCCIAPERFYNSLDSSERSCQCYLSVSVQGELTFAMDIFSLGCLLAELFNDGIPLFSYSQLLAYHDNKYEPENALGSISDPRIKDLIAHMVQRDPQQRLDAQGYLLRWSSSGTYSTFLLAKFTISLVVGLSEEISAGFHDYCNTFSAFSLKAEEKIEQLEMLLAPPMPQVLGFCFFFYKSLIRSLPASSTPQGSESPLVIVIALITSLIQSVSLSSSKVKALKMLMTLADWVCDEYRLDRMLPAAVSLLSDPATLVRVQSIKTITRLTECVRSVSLANANVFPEYILVHLSGIVGKKGDHETLVRITYAECIPTLARTALRFLEGVHGRPSSALNEDDVDLQPFEQDLHELQTLFKAEVKIVGQLILAQVRCTLLSRMPSLCQFFGKDNNTALLLSHLSCYLNESDWRLRLALVNSLATIAPFVGTHSIQQFVLPLLSEGLHDLENDVIVAALEALCFLYEATFIEYGQLNKFVAEVAPLLIHSSVSSLASNAIHFYERCCFPGTLFTTLLDQTSSVNDLDVSKDNKLVAVAMDDGSILLWNSEGLTDSACQLPQIFSRTNERMVKTKFFNQSRSIAFATSTGTVGILSVDRVSEGNSALSCHTIEAKEVGKLTDLHCANAGNLQDLLVFSTLYGHVYGWDTRCNRVAWNVKTESSEGALNCLAVATNNCWMLSGSSKGFATLWDLRFGLPVSSWTQPCGGPINHMAQFYNPTLPVAAVATDSIVYVWDLLSFKCTHLITVTSDASHHNIEKVVKERLDWFLVLKEVIIGSSDYCLRAWNLKTPSRSYQITSHCPLTKPLYWTRNARSFKILAECTFPAGDYIFSKHTSEWAESICKESVTSLASLTLGQTRLLITGSKEGAVRLFQPFY
ncbi:hypothetical protein Zmor_003943, partial [Zophobas morio]